MKEKKPISLLNIFLGVFIGIMLIIIIGIFGPTLVINLVPVPAVPRVVVPKVVSTAKPDLSNTIEFTNVSISVVRSYTKVIGEVKNNGSETRTIVYTVSFFNSESKLLGIARGSLSNVTSGEVKTFEASGEGDFVAAASYKIQVDTIY